MITCQAETFAGILDELKPILPQHYSELALNQDEVPLDPQYDIYLQREQNGEVLVVTLRESGILCGYFIGFVSPALHYKTCLTCIMDIFYVVPEWRGHGGGQILFRGVEREIKNRGVNRIFVGSKLHKDASWLFEKMGYTEVERYYTKWFGE